MIPIGLVSCSCMHIVAGEVYTVNLVLAIHAVRHSFIALFRITAK